MTQMKRRHFLQFAGSALATLGLSALDLQQQASRYGRVLAQGTPRKLALLVGINEYPESKRFKDLEGCLTDVELQKHLLIHRFGFNQNDIEILTDAQATRDGVVTAFQEHLINQARPGDVVVFHFSGHGSRIVDRNPIDSSGLNSTFVMADDAATEEIVDDIPGQMLYLMMAELAKKTENVTVVLDCCHAGGGTRGNVRVRAARGGSAFQPSEATLAMMDAWRSRLGLSPEELQTLRRQGVAAGTVIASAQRNQFAADYQFSEFAAGAFTYLLTQHLWQQEPTFEQTMPAVQRRIRSLVAVQDPFIEVKPGTDNQRQPAYFTEPVAPAAEAVVLETLANNQVRIWLGGLDQNNIRTSDAGAVLTSVMAARGEPAKVNLSSRNGLIATGVVEGTVFPGELLHEAVRVIPDEDKLTIGLHVSLSDAERSVAREKFHENIRTVEFQGEEKLYGEADYLFGRMTSALRQEIQAQEQTLEMPAEGSLGLLSPALDIVPQSFDSESPRETVESALDRLRAKFLSLLALRRIRQLLNPNSSLLNVAAVLKLEEGAEILAEVYTLRGGGATGNTARTSRRGDEKPFSQQLPKGEYFQVVVTNQESQPLYLGILDFSSAGKMTILFPNNFQTDQAIARTDLDATTLIEAESTVVVPDPEKDPFYFFGNDLGYGEMLILLSLRPLAQTLTGLERIVRSQGMKRGSVDISDNPLQVIDSLVNDLTTQRSRSGGGIGVTERTITTSIAVLSISYEVV